MAWLPVFGAVAAVVGLLVAVVGRYDYHRDELYFRILEPAWGYVDQPPLTPLLARVSVALFGDTLTAVRVPAILAAAAVVVVVALLVREFGGRAGAQAMGAWGVGFAMAPLSSGHVLLTASVDVVVWLVVVLFAVKAVVREQPRWWLAVGVAVGIGFYNKYLVVLLLVGIAVAMLVTGPRGPLRSGWLWAGVGLAVVIAAPNLVYQLANGWPQLEMAGGIAEEKGPQQRLLLLPLQAVFLSPLALPVVVAGFAALVRAPRLRPFAVSYLVVLAIVLATGGFAVYTAPLLIVLFAAGCAPVVAWAGSRARRVLVGVLAVAHAAFGVVVGLPVLPIDVLRDTPVPAVSQSLRDQVGWPAYVEQIREVHRSLPEAERANTVLLTANYAEAGALDKYGADLPAVHSGHNELHSYGPPPDTATTVIIIGMDAPEIRSLFVQCDLAGQLDHGLGIDNEEQGRPILVCRQPQVPFSAVWEHWRHLD
ncbi:glycosyltransferase family 39 protein [Actinokineospora guangxiensis]|uniref:Glycosyltransferase family 39 protein n=1 Tax=Actinokineospora guangxiensis TaxID=1490288 RepID=A0ABW0EU88_9PSEU